MFLAVGTHGFHLVQKAKNEYNILICPEYFFNRHTLSKSPFRSHTQTKNCRNVARRMRILSEVLMLLSAL
ncbi:hypothetical protein COU79_03640 [Candidatus Peregrinibacteria bacterium CG10_big_fil_rev_8_21_14_0_10_54_7]|nr:MAG: hypothetical protein COU79_03640 [Candidatus Peregrinibacteria bacterium CG10_big_fil_rev_8_21_14_0_10_54_7]